MIQYKTKYTLLTLLALATTILKAQQSMPNQGESNIEVVFGVVLIILLGMFSYLFYIDKKVKKVEDKLNEIEK